MKDYDYKDEKYNYVPPKWQRGCRNFIWLIGTGILTVIPSNSYQNIIYCYI